MKFRTTFIFLLIAAGLAAYLKFVEPTQQTSQEREEHGREFVKIDRDKANAISIKSAEAKIELRKKDNNTWFIEEPLKDRADTMAISQLFTTLEMLKYDSAIGADGKAPDKDQIKDFGLANSETKIEIAGADKTVELQFGKDTAVEGKVYVKLKGANVVYVIGNDLKNQIAKKADEFRDKRLMDLAVGNVRKAVLKTADQELELEKKNEHWALVKPLKARGDDARIGDFISQAVTARIDTFVADGANLSAYGLEQPRGTISLTVEGNDQPTVLQIGANPKEEKDKEKTYAKLSTRDAVVLLPKTIEALLDKKPNDFRDKNLVRFENDIVDRITIEPAGKDKLVLGRDKENWVRKGDKDQPINGAVATRLLDDLKATVTTNFVADVATELPKYGLDNPILKVTLSSYSSENTAETKAGEKPIVTILFGKVEGAEVYAKLDDEPFIVSVPQSLGTSIVIDPLQLQQLTIYKNKAEDITAFEVTKDGQPTLSFERDKDKNWKLAKGDGTVNQTAAQSLVNTLAGLRAVRWIGPTTSEQGLEKPSEVVTFKTSGNTGGKLTLGAPSPETMTYATAEGLTGTFLVSQPDAGAFQAALIDKPAASAASATPAPGKPAAPGEKPKIEAVTPPVSAPPAAPPAPEKPQPTEAPTPPPPPQP